MPYASVTFGNKRLRKPMDSPHFYRTYKYNFEILSVFCLKIV